MLLSALSAAAFLLPTSPGDDERRTRTAADSPATGTAAFGTAPAGSPSSATAAPRPGPTSAAPRSAAPTESPRRTATTSRAAQSRTAASGNTAQEDQVTALVNQERADAGCGPLRTDERLRSAARGHSQDMAGNHYFSHTGLTGSTFVDRIAAAGYPRNQAGGENIAMGYRTPAAVMDGWMNSDGHRANILNCDFEAIGVGLARDSAGALYWTQDFGRS